MKNLFPYVNLNLEEKDYLLSIIKLSSEVSHCSI